MENIYTETFGNASGASSTLAQLFTLVRTLPSEEHIVSFGEILADLHLWLAVRMIIMLLFSCVFLIIRRFAELLLRKLDIRLVGSFPVNAVVRALLSR